jgi:hypothetical protein
MEVKPLGPVQLYVTPETRELPESATDVDTQVSCPLSPAVAPGAVLSSVTITGVVEIQPLTRFATVNVYVPIADAEGFCKEDEKLSGPVQL